MENGAIEDAERGFRGERLVRARPALPPCPPAGSRAPAGQATVAVVLLQSLKVTVTSGGRYILVALNATIKW